MWSSQRTFVPHECKILAPVSSFPFSVLVSLVLDLATIFLLLIYLPVTVLDDVLIFFSR